MAEYKVYTETNENGEYKVIEKPNGIKTSFLRVPSESYKAKMALRAEQERIRQQVEAEKEDIRKKIENKKRQMAIDELLSSGEITQEELSKINL